MAIRMRMQWDGVTEARYEEVRGIVDWEGDPPAGGLLHEAWFSGDQLNVCDVWETAEEFNAFVQNRLMPGVARVGITGQPTVGILPIHNWQLEKPLVDGAVVEEDALPADAYRALEAKVGWREVPPIGGISHVAALDGDMIQLVTVWESEAAASAFEADRIGPAAASLGFPPAEEHVAFHPLHALSDVAGTLAPAG